jgi:hypothetical protein
MQFGPRLRLVSWHDRVAGHGYRTPVVVLERVLAPGDRIDILEFAAALQVSRTPLLTAIDRLQIEGLIGRRGRHNARFIVAESDAEQAHAALATLNMLFKVLARDDDRQIAHNAFNEFASEPTGEQTNRLRHDLVGICDRARNPVIPDVVRRRCPELRGRGQVIVRRIAGRAGIGAAAGVGAGVGPAGGFSTATGQLATAGRCSNPNGDGRRSERATVSSTALSPDPRLSEPRVPRWGTCTPVRGPSSPGNRGALMEGMKGSRECPGLDGGRHRGGRRFLGQYDVPRIATGAAP